MNVIEVGDTFNCDCGFSWKRGQSGSHSCGDGLRKQIAELQQKLDAVLAEVAAIREQSGVVYSAGYRHGHLNTVDGCAYAPADGEFYHHALQVMLEVETPVTDALLNAMRAEAIRDFWNDYLADVGHVLEEIGAYQDASEAAGIVHDELKERVEDFAAQLLAETDTTSSQYESLAGGK